ncbi:cytochrome P450, partial [Protomyces lactucae-debilis]
MEERPLLDAIIKEALRLYSAIPMTLPRVTSKALVIDGIPIPAGVKVGASAYVLHRNRIFEKPDVFEPTRWLAATPAMCRHFWPFSSGSRVCIGQHLAMLELKVLVSAMIKQVDMTLAGTCDMAQEERVSSFAMLPRGKKLNMQFTRSDRM